ncbi:MAG: alpha-glucan family phosphorylase [Bacteroidetes bacterium]|jgi:starch phosphorylase|nr:alpha-glucan family phosphorylase [Bacteroidota bacterium]
MLRPIQTFTVAPSIPPELSALTTLAQNLMWAWVDEPMAVFMRLDPDLWESTHHNPVQMLGSIRQERLNTLARDDAFLAQLDRAVRRYQEYIESTGTWYAKGHPEGAGVRFAYFSAEFGLTECLQTYSGGLGILSGDHLKAASDLGVPLIGVGLLYQQGYFRQYLNADGWQQERYPENDFFSLPIALERNKDGTPLTISVDLPGRTLHAQIWRVQVGRVPLYLLDTNIPQNSHDDQNITDQLYGGDRELRIKQEILLGIGGYRALKALGIQPDVYHLNEGHSAFLTLEHCRELIAEKGLTFREAREATIASTVFTTHTPVPAGNDYFAPELVERYFASYYPSLNLSSKDFHSLGRENVDNERESFCMTVLALRMSGKSNGVSKLHGEVSRQMWKNVWPKVPVHEVPIISITNGVHAPSWVSHDLGELYDRYLGPKWREDAGQFGLWSRVHHIPDEELWRTHERRRERLVAFARHRLRGQLEARGTTATEIAQADEILNPEALTIGFARRFATYKRATLLLRNPERLIALLNSKDRPIQFIFAGKAHPHDTPGKELIRQIIHFERRADVRRRMVFIEDYDMVVARYLVQGVDVWLNTPRRPLEASGTSGMKATMNGGLNASILDGWWVEGYNANTGWAIGRGEDYRDEKYQDEVESNALFDLLEKDIIPLYYHRSADDLPRGWISKMKSAIRTIGPEFNTNRMVREYAELMYLPSSERMRSFSANGFKRTKEIASWKEDIHRNWHDIRITNVALEAHDGIKVGDVITLRATIDLGSLEPEDVLVEACYGSVNAAEMLEHPVMTPMTVEGKANGTSHTFTASIKLEVAGRVGHTVRVLPSHRDLVDRFHEGLIIWATS